MAEFVSGPSGATVPTTTKGDLSGFSTVPARIPVGTDGQALVADSTQPLGVKWGAAGAVSVLDAKSGAGASFDFTGITAVAGTDLEIVLLGRSDAAALNDTLILTFNNDSGAHYDWQMNVAVNASAVGAVGNADTSVAIAILPAATATAGAPGIVKIVIPCYSDTTFHKVFLAQASEFRTEGTPTAQFVRQVGGLWRDTSAINRITIKPTTGAFIAGSKAVLRRVSATP
jgi:hypothetical protein